MKKQTWVLAAIALTFSGCAEAAKIKGNRMQDQVEKIVTSFEDLYTTPTSDRITELEFKVLDLEWDGIFLAAQKTVPTGVPGIPILSLAGSTAIREWEVEFRKNSTVVAMDLDRGISRTWPLYPAPIKKKLPQPKPPKPGPEGATDRQLGCKRFVIGESLTEALSAGEYVISIISWDRVSNSRIVKKLGETKKENSPALQAQVVWPWDQWSDAKRFHAGTTSPKLEAGKELAIGLEGKGHEQKILGSFLLKARPIHLVSDDAKGRTDATIHAGVNVDLFLFTLDDPIPEQVRIVVPINTSAPIKAGEDLKGWFSIPFPFAPVAKETMIFGIVDGTLAGPIKVGAVMP